MPQKTWARGQESPSWYCLNVNWKTPFHAEPRQNHLACIGTMNVRISLVLSLSSSGGEGWGEEAL